MTVPISPGYQFGPASDGHIRICYAREETEWARALDDMVSVLKALAPERVRAAS